MKKTTYASEGMPTANVAVNKSRVKLYNNAGELPTYYLQKGQEFQIELFNPTSETILAKIQLNGSFISQGGLILNPGERVFLERYLDVARKFLFDTYEVSDTKEVKKAIRKNGDISVSFFKEILITPSFTPYIDHTVRPYIFYGPTTTLGLCNTDGITNGITTSVNAFYNCTDNNQLNLISNSSYSDSIMTNSSSSNINSTYASRGITLDDLEKIRVNKFKKSSLIKKGIIETGRVDQGSTSEQEFTFVNKKFEPTPFHKIEYKLLPISQKINTVDDLNVKIYCTQCGSKLGKTDKFCSNCGHKA